MIYVDHNATTRVRPEVLEVMARVERDVWANPSSPHTPGAAARRCVDRARDLVATLLGMPPDGVVFTSGGTEANNLALRGVLGARPGERPHLVVSAIEHHSVLRAADALAAEGFPVTRVPSEASGVIALEALRKALRDDTALVSAMWVNNETGNVQDVAAFAGEAHARGARVHADAVQGAGKLDVEALREVDLVTISGHKIEGPKGTGALCLRGSIDLTPQLVGGGQEGGRRSGTPNVSGIAGLGEACRLAALERSSHARHLAALTTQFEGLLRERLPGVVVHGAGALRAPGTSCFSVARLDASTALAALDLAGVAASSGAACTTGAVAPSHVLLALGVSEDVARCALRVSFGRTNTEDEARRIVALLEELTARLQMASIGGRR